MKDVKRSHWSRRHGLVVAVAAIGCWTMLAVRNGAEQVDSGWAVATPSPVASGSTNSYEQELVIRHVLEQTRQTQVPKPAPKPSAQATQPGPAASSRKPAAVRFADGPNGTDGWRSTEQSSAALKEDWTTRPAAPPPAPAERSPKATVPFEVDCNGAACPAKKATSPQANLPAPMPTMKVATLPQPASPVKSATPDDGAPEQTSPTDDAAEPTTNDANAIAPETSAEGQTSAAPAESQPAAETQEKPKTESNAVAPEPPSADVEPAVELPPLTRQMLALKNRVRSVLRGYYRKALASRENDPWEVMHGMLAYGVHSRIHNGGPNGELITSVGWLCYNKPCKGQTLLYVTPAGELRAKYGVGLQGHLGQFLAMLAQCHVSPDYPIHVGDHEFTIRDLIEAEKLTCYPKSELTFKLLALQHYIDLNDKWVNDQGVEWDFPRLVREELEQPIRGAACGGTHRLSGLSLTVKTRLRRGEPLDGEYQRANDFVKKYQMYAFRLQNRDGSLSTSWFRGGGDDDDIDRRIKTSGHILEWLCYSLSDEQLREPQMVKAVTYVANLMYSNYDHEWEVGPRSHATHALLLYDERVFQPYDKQGEIAVYRPAASNVAKRNTNGTMRR